MEGENTSTPRREMSFTKWKLCGSEFPRKEIIYLCQIIILYSVIIVGLANLTMWWNTEDNSWRQFWIGLVSGSLGYLLPQPKI